MTAESLFLDGNVRDDDGESETDAETSPRGFPDGSDERFEECKKESVIEENLRFCRHEIQDAVKIVVEEAPFEKKGEKDCCDSDNKKSDEDDSGVFREKSVHVSILT